ncbi:STAS domain-containing protein [Mucilaginibacter glaciei]|uniref:STAS domain-containing protein n=1 Tax=Mucilaginibacter glaciei TaxID=2772109 RepID=A0A926S0P8_9SPHI|nr:STAS domain-containing protein [Mucilaginibacter glaciei]MBD1391962.1 STAS domain-containing protein [Mucilaginibacter glaciei]
MIVTTQINGAALVANVTAAEANLMVADAFKADLASLIDDGNKLIVVNFAAVIYVDSSFLGALVSGLKYAMANQAEIVVAGLNKDIFGLFQLIRLDKAFKIFTTVDEAAKSR